MPSASGLRQRVNVPSGRLLLPVVVYNKAVLRKSHGDSIDSMLTTLLTKEPGHLPANKMTGPTNGKKKPERNLECAKYSKRTGLQAGVPDW